MVRIQNASAASYDFTLTGDATGSTGAASHFEGRVVVKSGDNATYVPLTMSSATQGTASVQVTPADGQVYLVVVSVPEHFTSNQTYGYSYQIGRR